MANHMSSLRRGEQMSKHLPGVTPGEWYLAWRWCHRLTVTWWDHEIAAELCCADWRKRMAKARERATRKCLLTTP